MPGHDTKAAIRRASAKLEARETEAAKPSLSSHVETLQAKYLALAQDIIAKYGQST